jgi:hypothetical protein
MNIIKRVILVLAVVCCGIFVVSCTNEELSSDTKGTKFEELRFEVHVNNISINTRAASDKKNWSIGDKIFVTIDSDDNNLCVLEYIGNGDWRVSKVTEQADFANARGKLNAVHADQLIWNGNRIITSGDILSTQDGFYTKHDNVVVINLDMSIRPICRIAIVGMDKSCWIDGLEEYTQLNSLSAMKWNTTSSSRGSQYKEVVGDTCFFMEFLVLKIMAQLHFIYRKLMELRMNAPILVS